MGSEMCIRDRISDPGLLDSESQKTNYGLRELLDYGIPSEIPGNIAGGLSGYGTPPLIFPDTRKITGEVILQSNFDPEGKLLSIDLTLFFIHI